MNQQASHPIVRVDGLKQKIMPYQATMRAIAPPHVDWARVCGAVVHRYATDQKLADCEHDSIVAAIFESIAYGLIPSSVRNLAHLVPFRNHGVKQCQLIVGYQGYMTMALRHPKVLGFEVPKFVYPADEFDYYTGTETFIRHRENFEDRGDSEWTKAYVVARVRDMQPIPFVWPREKFIALRDSIAKRNHWTPESKVPWYTHFDQMCSKTTLIRVCNPLPKQSDLELALGRESLLEAGKWEPVRPEEIKPPTMGDEDEQGE